MPTRKWYAVGAIILIVGLAAGGLVMTTRLARLTASLQQVVVPGERELELNEPGAYTLFHETRSVVDGKVYSTSDLQDLEFAMVSVATDSVLKMRPTTGTTSYDLGGRSGVSVASFEVPAAGRYRLLSRYPDGRGEPRGVLALGKGAGSAMVSAILSTLAVVFGSFLIGFFIAFKTWRRRRSSAPTQPGHGV